MCFSKDLSKYGDYAAVVLRLAVAAIFLYHGTQKWSFWSATPEGMSDTMVLIFKFLSIAEPLAGVGVLLGLCTQLAAGGLCLVMISALTMKISGGAGFGKFEFDLILLAANIVLVIEGPGKYSLDATWKKKRR